MEAASPVSVHVTDRGVGVRLIWNGSATTGVPTAGLPGLAMKRQKTAVTVSFVGVTVPVIVARGTAEESS